MTTTIDFMTYEDENGIYFNKIDSETKQIICKVRPFDLGFLKEIKTTIIVYKKVSSSEQIADEEIFFELPITFSFPEDKAREFRYAYFYRCRSGEIAVRDFSNGMCDLHILNGELVIRGKAKKLPSDTRIARTTAIYEIDPNTGELRRFLNPDNNKFPITISEQ